MRSLRKHLHKTVLLGMLPLAAFSGMPATSCFCANGHLKLFCAGHYAASKAHSQNCGSPLAHQAKHPSCCGQAHDAGADTDSVADCCQSRHGSSPPCGTCCKQIAKVLTTTVASASMPAVDLQVFAVVPAEVVVSHAFLSLRNAQLERIDTGPPIDLVITLRTLLI
jgi:hypothetical protein